MVNMPDSNGEPAIFYAVRGGHLDCMALLLSADADVTMKDGTQRNILHCACESNQPQIMNTLFEKHSKSMLNMRDCMTQGGSFQGTPLHFAANLGYTDCVKICIKQNCDLKKCAVVQPSCHYTALQLSSDRGHYSVLNFLLDYDKTLIEEETSSDEITSLHLACRSGHSECVECLLKAGADLSALCKDKDGQTKSAMDLLMSRINSPVDLMTKILDSCVSYSKNLTGHRCIDVDYQILLPEKDSTEQNLKQPHQLKVIDALLKTGDTLGQRGLLTHPVVESFLHLQWNKLSAFFYIAMAIYTTFVISFTCVTLMTFTDMLRESYWFAYFCHTLTILTLPILLNFEIAQIYIIGNRYLKQIEPWVKMVCYILYPCSIIPVALHSYNGVQEKISDWTYQVGAVAVLFGWLELMLLLSRIPKYGHYVQMFIRVAQSFVKVFCSFACFIIGFVLAFFVAFKGKSHFPSIWDSFVKIIVMMTSEYDYGELFKKYENASHDDYYILPCPEKEIRCERYANNHVVFLKSIFIFFLLFVGIVLTNVIIAVAVNDVKNLANVGKIDRLHRQASFLLCCVFCLPYKFIRPISPVLQINIEDYSLNEVALSERLIRAMMAKAEANKQAHNQLN